MSGPDRRSFVATDAAPLRDVLAALGEPVVAVEEGRVLVGRARATDAAALVQPGEVVTVSRAQAALPEVRVVHRDRDLLVVDKPAGVPTIPDERGAAHSLLALAARAIGRAPSDLHPTSRLDRDVSGLVTFALSRAGRERLEAARDQGTYGRVYVALASRAPSPPQGEWAAPIGRAASPRLRRVDPRGLPSASRYAVIDVASGVALVRLEPVTGRTHQLRVHAAAAGAPLLGDRAYGGPTRVTLPSGRVLGLARIYLHCACLSLPAASGPVTPRADVPAALRDAWAALGGAPSAWDLAAAP